MPYPAAEVAGILRRGRQGEGAATVNVRTATVNVRTQEKLILESHDEVLEGALSYLESRWAGTARLLWVTDGLPKQTCV